ncbi:cytochrome c oxidase subunit 1, partial [Irineochytrium annulatum]
WVEDMTTLTDLTENAIMENLRRRYASKLIYTYTGTILVAMNPYESLEIYGTSHVRQYSNLKASVSLPPHIYALADRAIANVRAGMGNQSVIISGESGAGKSESTKSILEYWTSVTTSAAVGSNKGGSGGVSPGASSNGETESWVQQQVLEANTVLESFGNAKTVRNNNSSRFGKFIQVQLNARTQIVGASIVSYLLEKSRIARQSPTERNYHVFYEFMAGCSDEERKRYGLLDTCEEYHYLSQSGCVEIANVSDRKQFQALRLALTVLNFGDGEIDGILRALSAILWLGNVSYKDDASKESVRIADAEVVERVAGLLGVDKAKLTETLRFRKLTVRNEVTMVPLKPTQAVDNRDGIAKSIYDNLFQRILEFINNSLLAKQASKNFTGVLDIFGFEVFQVNSFEQFCINYTNEKLQQFFNQFIFKLEQEEYDREAIKWDKITFTDNQLCLDLIEVKPAGILALLDEETKVPKGSDESWLGKLFQGLEKQPHFIKPKTSKTQFGVKHYAGDVFYSIHGFMEKNKDAIQDELIEVVQKSSIPFISKLFKKTVEAESPGAGPGKVAGKPTKQTASAYFKNQLVTLVSTLGATMPHYVRCIKPNPDKEPFGFEDGMVLSQLRYSGMLDTIRIRKAGYPMRIPFETLCRAYRCLLPGALMQKGSDSKLGAAEIIKRANFKTGLWQQGKSKMFLKMEAFDALQSLADKLYRAKALIIQKNLRAYAAKRKYAEMKKQVKVLQRYVKGYIYFRRYKRVKEAAVKIQSAVRGWYARDYFRKLKQKAAEHAENERRQQQERLEKERRQQQMLANAAAEVVKANAGASLPADRSAAPAVADGFTGAAMASSSPPPTNGKLVIDTSGDAENLKLMAAAVQKKKEMMEAESQSNPSPLLASADPLSNPAVDDLFSFLGDFSAASDLARLAANLTSEIDSILQSSTPATTTATATTANAGSGEGGTPATVQNAEPGSREEVSKGGASQRESQEALASPAKTPRGLKANPLVKTNGRGSTESISGVFAAGGKINPNSSEWSMVAFAEKNFEIHEKKKQKGLLGIGKRTKPQLQDLDEMLRHTRHNITMSITRIPNNEGLQSVAVECFKNVQKAMDPNAKKQDESVQIIQNILTNGLDHPELRDEILVQIIKQMTPPLSDAPKGWDSIVLHGWQMIALAAGTFPPSKVFSKFFLAFILRGLSEPDEKHKIRKLARIAEEAFKNSTLSGARKLPPSIAEITAIRDGKNTIPCRFHLLNGMSEEIPITSVTTAADVVKEIASRISLRDSVEHAIKATEYIADVITSLEKETRRTTQTSSTATMMPTLSFKRRKDEPTTPSNLASGVFNHEIQLVMKKRVFKNPRETVLDPTEHNLLYAQAVDNVNRDVYNLSPRDAVKLAALRAQVLLGDCDHTSALSRFAQNLGEWLVPRIVSANPRDALARSIVEQYAHLRGTSTLQAKFLYLETVKSLRYYGTSIYPARYQGFWTFSEGVLLAVFNTGVEFLQSNSKEFLQEGSREVIMAFTYGEIKSFGSDGDVITIVINRSSGNDEIDGNETYNFASEHADEISSLMREYAPTKIGKTREKLFTDQEVAALQKDLEKSRAAVIEKGIVRVPGPESMATNLASFASSGAINHNPRASKRLNRASKLMAKNRSQDSLKTSRESFSFASLSMSSLGRNASSGADAVVKSADNLDASGSSRFETEYTERDWSFSSTRLITSLVNPNGVEIEDWAISLHSLMTAYAGITSNVFTSSEPGVVPYSANIQGFLSKCMTEPLKAIELYLQLIKMTTAHPDPDSHQSLQLWRLMCVAVGVVVPASNTLLECLKAHLRRSIAVDFRSKTPRKQEAACAKYCLKTLHRTLSSAPRKYPPSCDEIMFATKQSPMSIRFHALNGQFRAMSVDPSDTVENIYMTLAQKFNLVGINGFAIFTIFGGV